MFGACSFGSVAMAGEVPPSSGIIVVPPVPVAGLAYRGPRCIWHFWGAR